MASELDSAEGEASSAGIERRVGHIIAVGGGKGGAGKSLLAANLGIFLATLGKRVVLLDADLGGANLHTFVGVERPRVTIGDVVAGKVQRIEDAVAPTSVPGLGLLSGEGDPSWIANPRRAQRNQLLEKVKGLAVDVLVIDLGPGSGETAIDFFLMADQGVLVVVPEPTSVENTYRFVKSAFLRRLKLSGVDLAALELGNGIVAPLDLYSAAIQRGDTALAEELSRHMARLRPGIVVNQVRTRADAELSEAMARASWRRLGLAAFDLGSLEADDAVWLAVRKRRPLLVEHATSRVAKGIERVTRRLLALEQDGHQHDPPALTAPTHYEVLEIDPAATDEEIRRAHRRVRERYGHDGLAVCGLYDRERLATLHLRIEEAYDTLMDAQRRRSYDRALFPDGLPRRKRSGEATPLPEARADSQPRAASQPPVELEEGPPIELDPEQEITGAFLRELRESRGVDLRTIAQKTKIGVAHLRDLEDERFAAMPAVVYVRGFLTSYARFLRLPVERVLATYLPRYQAARAGQAEEA